jgi:hypothetical protein
MQGNNATNDRTRRRRPDGQWRQAELEAALEIITVDGEEGRRLAQQQATVFRDILTWLQNNRTAQQSDHDADRRRYSNG